MEGGKGHPMKDLEDIYVENYLLGTKPAKSAPTIDPEKEIQHLKRLFIDIHYGLKSFKRNDVKLYTIARIIRAEMFKVYNSINISLRKEKPIVDFSTMPLIKKIALIQGYINSVKFSIDKLIDYYKTEGNEYVVKQLENSQKNLSTPSKLFDKHMFIPYKEYLK